MRFTMWFSLTIAVSATSAQTGVPIRPLGKTVAVSPMAFGTAQLQVHQLASGRTLVLDPSHRLVVLLDGTLAHPVTVIDSAAGLPNSYGTRGGAIIPYPGDSTLFVDVTASTFLVIDPIGGLARVIALPTGQNVGFYLTAGISAGLPGVDAAGRLIYWANAPRRPASPGRGAAPPPAPGAKPDLPASPDSALLVAFSFQNATIDTVGSFRIPTSSSAGDATPLPTLDSWGVTSDGVIAVVKGQDYHVDWITADRTKTSTPRIPYDWRHLSDEDKQRVADSLTAVRDSTTKARLAALPAGARPIFSPAGSLLGYSPLVPGSPPPSGPAPVIPTPTPIPSAAIPDYFPPITTSGAVRTDADGRVWILTAPTKVIPGGPVYDVVSRTGVLIDRVQLPVGHTLVGFGAGGIVYLGSSDGGVAHLEKAQFK